MKWVNRFLKDYLKTNYFKLIKSISFCFYIAIIFKIEENLDFFDKIVLIYTTINDFIIFEINFS